MNYFNVLANKQIPVKLNHTKQTKMAPRTKTNKTERNNNNNNNKKKNTHTNTEISR